VRTQSRVIQPFKEMWIRFSSLIRLITLHISAMQFLVILEFLLPHLSRFNSSS